MNKLTFYSQALKCYQLATEIHRSAMGGHCFTARAITQVILHLAFTARAITQVILHLAFTARAITRVISFYLASVILSFDFY